MKVETTLWLHRLRLQATEPGTLFVAIKGRAGRLLLYPDDILRMSDEQILSEIRQGFAALIQPQLQTC